MSEQQDYTRTKLKKSITMRKRGKTPKVEEETKNAKQDTKK